METIKGIPIREFGNSFNMVGTVYAKGEEIIIFYYPGEQIQIDQQTALKAFKLSEEEWQALFKQTDLKEVEMFQSDKGKIVKVIARKSERQINQNVQWKVFRRDNFACRYCGANDVPMTVDHLVLWENGGPTIPENLFTSCKKCNNVRGNTEYIEWLKEPYLKKVVKNLSQEQREIIFSIDEKYLSSIPIHFKKKKR